MRDEKSFQLIITLLHSSKFNEFISMLLSSLSLSLARSLQQSIISLLLWGSHLLNDRLTSVGGRKENKRRKKAKGRKMGTKKKTYTFRLSDEIKLLCWFCYSHETHYSFIRLQLKLILWRARAAEICGIIHRSTPSDDAAIHFSFRSVYKVVTE